MESGALTSYIDVAQVVLYAFWVFFAGLMIYLRREDKREGYPLESDRGPRVKVQGYPAMPDPKTFKTREGRTFRAPNNAPAAGREIRVRPVAGWPGAPMEPTGDPMQDGVGPASYAERLDIPDITLEGAPKIVPMRVDTTFSIPPQDPDPRGMPVIAGDGERAGTVVDVWVDRSEVLIRYYEVEVPVAGGSRRVLLPANYTKVSNRRVNVKSLFAAQFAGVPGTRNPDTVTFLEEDRIVGYFAGGYLYASPSRMGPLL